MQSSSRACSVPHTCPHQTSPPPTSCAAQAQLQAGAFSAQQLTNIAWALGRWQVTPPEAWQMAFWGQLMRRAGELEAQGVACVLWGVACGGWRLG